MRLARFKSEEAFFNKCFQIKVRKNGLLDKNGLQQYSGIVEEGG
jgi:hypothetical protein